MAKGDERLKAKIIEILQEIRIVLPGTEALLGFQFVIFFDPVFQDLSANLKYLHFGTLILTMTCTILLIAPVAFQQIGEEGHATNRFLGFCRKVLNIAMALLLLALAGDIFIAAQLIDLSNVLSSVTSAFILLLGISVWYLYAYLKRGEPEIK